MKSYRVSVVYQAVNGTEAGRLDPDSAYAKLARAIIDSKSSPVLKAEIYNRKNTAFGCEYYVEKFCAWYVSYVTASPINPENQVIDAFEDRKGQR